MKLNLRECAHILQAPAPEGGEKIVVERVVLDSRRVRPGDLYVPLPGRYHDGHEFVLEALQRGAAALFGEAQPLPGKLVGETRILRVPDPFRALWALAEHKLRQQRVRSVVITGSAGKTTLKELLHAAMRQSLKVGKTPGNLNSMQGVPLTVLNELQPHHQWFIWEAGANRPEEIRKLSGLLRGELGIITNIGLAHVGLFGNPEGVGRAKRELWTGLVSGGTALYPKNSSVSAEPGRDDLRKVTFGVGPSSGADWEVIPREMEGDGRFRVEVEGLKVRAPLPGGQGVALTAPFWSAARLLGVDPAALQETLRVFRAPKGRLQLRRLGSWTIIDDSYNASPESLQQALELLRGLPVTGRRIAVLAGMLELGELSEELHRRVGRAEKASPLDYYLVLGEEARPLFSELPEPREFFRDRQELADHLRALLQNGDAVLFKGSRGFGLERVIEELENE